MDRFQARRATGTRGRLTPAALLSVLFLVLACNKQETPARANDSSMAAGTPTDSVTYQTSWNMGRDPGEPENSYNSRFSVSVRQVSSGRLDVFLSADSIGQTTVVDSVWVNGLASTDHFTEGCLREQNSKPIIAILRDSVYERRSHPRFAWSIDTLSRRFIKLSAESVVCFIAGPD